MPGFAQDADSDLVVERYSRSTRLPPSDDGVSLWEWALFGLCQLALIAGIWLYFSSWPPMDTIKHYLALPDCSAARMLGIAPSRRGDPGYWGWHDPDGNGVACEAALVKRDWARWSLRDSSLD